MALYFSNFDRTSFLLCSKFFIVYLWKCLSGTDGSRIFQEFQLEFHSQKPQALPTVSCFYFYHISKNSDQEKQMTSPNDSFSKFMQGGQCLIIVFFHRCHSKNGFNLVLRLNLTLLHHMHHRIDGITISTISLKL